MELLDLPDELLDYIISFLSFNDWKKLSRSNKLFFDFTTPYLIEHSVIQTNRRDKNLCGLRNLQRTYVNVSIDNKPFIESDSVTPKNVYIAVTNGRVANMLLQNTQSFKFINECKTVEKVFLNVKSNEQEEPNIPEFLLRTDISFYIDTLTISFKTCENIWAKVNQWVSVCPNIRKLCVLVTRYSEEEEVQEIKDLVKFKFEELSLKNIGNKELVGKLVNSSNKLKTLIFNNCNLLGLRIPSNLRKFECINNEAKNIDDVIKNQKFLETLIVEKVIFTKGFLEILSRNKFLSNLEIYNCELGEEETIGFNCLSKIVNLKLLSIPKSQYSYKESGFTDEDDLHEPVTIDKLGPIVWNHLEKVEHLAIQIDASDKMQLKTLDGLKHIEIIDLGRNTSTAIKENLRAKSLVYCQNCSTQSKIFLNCDSLNIAHPIGINILRELCEALKERKVKNVFLKLFSITSQQLEVFFESDIENITFNIDFPIGYSLLLNFGKMLNLVMKLKEKYNNIEVETNEDIHFFTIFKDSLKVVMRIEGQVRGQGLVVMQQ